MKGGYHSGMAFLQHLSTFPLPRSARFRSLALPYSVSASSSSSVASPPATTERVSLASDQRVLIGMSLQELQHLSVELGEQSYRGKQIHHLLYQRKLKDIHEFVQLPQAFRNKLQDSGWAVGRSTVHQSVTAADGTIKLLMKLEDNRLVETVGIPVQDDKGAVRLTACVSSQVGCPLRCSFCATGKGDGAQMAIFESLLSSSHRTTNGDEADFFFVPVLDSCIITRADDTPHFTLKDYQGLRSSLTLEFYKKAHQHIVEQYPYWNRSSGKDHIWFFSWDEGACYAPKEIWNSMMLVHWGNTNSKHNHSTTAYWADNWDMISDVRRGKHPCFNPSKDLVLPAWKRPDGPTLKSKLWARSREQRTTLFYFNGNLGPAYNNGRPEATYSMGIRQKVAEEFGSSPNKEGKLGKQHQDDVIVTPLRSVDYHGDLSTSVFCGVFPGDGWSGRMEDSILQGCVPVIIQDGIYLPYENVLNYESFAVRIREDEIPNMMKILRAFNETEIQFKLANVQKIWQRFMYRDSMLLEANRQKSTFSHEDDWAVELSQLSDDDVFATLIQVLHYKLHHDPWRRQLQPLKKEFGLTKQCSKISS